MSDSFSNISVLKQRIEQGQEKYDFNIAAELSDIEIFEKAFSLVLPDSYKEFLQIANGGMITEYDWSDIPHFSDDDAYGPKMTSNLFFSLTEMRDKYLDFRGEKWLMEKSFIGVHPLIPICRTSQHNLIFIVSEKKCTQESPVFIAFDNSNLETCEQIAPNFNAFLGDYLKNDGFPNFKSYNGNNQLGDYFRENEILKIAEHLDHYSKVLEKVEALMILFPDDPWNFVERGSAYIEAEKYKLALDDFNKAIELKSNISYFYFCRGDLILKYGSARKALIDLDIAVKLEPKESMYLAGRAEAFYSLKKYKNALDDLNKALEIDGSYEMALICRINVYRKLGEDEKADADSAILDDLLKQ
jgi:tetratricopeptide (TPR) repeat protein